MVCISTEPARVGRNVLPYESALVLVVLGSIAHLAGFSILRFIAYIKDELFIVLGTSSSETVLPHMIQKMEHLGASKSVVGLVVPTGYTFNLDGTNIYMTLAICFWLKPRILATFGQLLAFWRP